LSTTLVSCAWFPGGGWCGPDGYTDRQQRASFGIQGQLPSTSPFDMIDDGPTSVNVNYRDTHGNTTGLSYGLPRLLMMKFHVCQGDKILQAYMFDSSMYVATTSALTWCIVVDLVLFLSTSLLRQLPENYSAFPGISGRLFLKIHSDGFAAPLQLVFLPFLTKFLMKGLVRWVLPVCYCMEYCPLEIT